MKLTINQLRQVINEELGKYKNVQNSELGKYRYSPPMPGDLDDNSYDDDAVHEEKIQITTDYPGTIVTNMDEFNQQFPDASRNDKAQASFKLASWTNVELTVIPEVLTLKSQLTERMTVKDQKIATKNLKTIVLNGWKFAGSGNGIVAEWVKNVKGRAFVLQVNSFPVKYGKGTGEFSGTIWFDRGHSVISFGAPAINFSLDNAAPALIELSETADSELLALSKKWI